MRVVVHTARLLLPDDAISIIGLPPQAGVAAAPEAILSYLLAADTAKAFNISKGEGQVQGPQPLPLLGMRARELSGLGGRAQASTPHAHRSPTVHPRFHTGWLQTTCSWWPPPAPPGAPLPPT